MSVSAISNALVHQSALSTPEERSRHATFITRRLALAAAALAVAPFFLAFRGAPSVSQALAFAWSFAPLAAAMLVVRTGRLALGHGVAAFGLIGLGSTLWASFDFGAVSLVVCCAAALFEAAQAYDRRLSRIVALAIVLCMGGVLFFDLTGARAGFPHAPELIACLAGVYVALISIGLPKQREIALPSSDAAFWTVSSELVEEFVVGFDSSGSVVRVPPSSKALAGTNGSELRGRGLFELVHVADRPNFLKVIVDAAHGDAPTPARIRLRAAQTIAPNGEPARPRHVWFELKATRVAEKCDDLDLAVVAAFRDIDAATALDAGIVAAQSSVEEAIRSKDHFLANMSHELRTPLNAIIGFSEILASHTLRPADSDKQREYARIINQSGQHLLGVVNSILDMSKIQSGTFALAPESFKVIPLLDLCCDMVALSAEDGGIQLVRDYPADLEQLVGDKRACKQIVINLLSNAVKFTPQGGQVTLSARPDGNALLLTVIDTGIGIGTSDLARVGDPFFQARTSLNRPFEGTGLGLSVVRGLVGLHGGQIELESEPGRGTRVRVRLPLDCLVGGDTRPSATIETLAPRRAHERTGHFEPRMKQIA